MRWLIDENVRRDVTLFLSDRGDDIAFVLSGSSDGDVFRSGKGIGESFWHVTRTLRTL